MRAWGVCGPSWVSLTDCPRDTSTCLRPSPATWGGGARHRASFVARRGSELRGRGWRGLGGHTMPLPHVRAAFLPEREGHDPKVGICPLMLPRVLSTQTQKSGLGSVNSQPKSAQCLGPSPKPMDSHCPMPWPRRGSRQSARGQRAGRMEPWSIRREWYTAQTPTLSANVRRGFSPLEHCQSAWLQLFLRPDSRDLGLYPESPGAPEARRLCASAGTERRA